MRISIAGATIGVVVIGVTAAGCQSGAKSSATSSVATPSIAAATIGATANPALPAAATGASSAAPGATSSSNACGLVSLAQVSAIIGVTYTSATPSLGGTVCSFATTQAPVPMFFTVKTNAGGDVAWNEELATLQADGTGDAPTSISGVGDRAAATGAEFGTQSGTTIIDINGGDPLTTGGGFPKSAALAKAIIAALH